MGGHIKLSLLCAEIYYCKLYIIILKDDFMPLTIAHKQAIERAIIVEVFKCQYVHGRSVNINPDLRRYKEILDNPLTLTDVDRHGEATFGEVREYMIMQMHDKFKFNDNLGLLGGRLPYLDNGRSIGRSSESSATTISQDSVLERRRGDSDADLSVKVKPRISRGDVVYLGSKVNIDDAVFFAAIGPKEDLWIDRVRVKGDKSVANEGRCCSIM